MKYIITTILVLILGGLSYGFYIKNTGDPKGEITIGLCVLATAFILMPLFIYHRYKNKNIKDFTFEKFRKDLEEHNEKQNNS